MPALKISFQSESSLCRNNRISGKPKIWETEDKEQSNETMDHVTLGLQSFWRRRHVGADGWREISSVLFVKQNFGRNLRTGNQTDAKKDGRK